jgi:hypothetical protein
LIAAPSDLASDLDLFAPSLHLHTDGRFCFFLAKLHRAGTVLQFPTLADAEVFLQSRGFRLVDGTCNWTNDDGDDAGVYSIEGYWGVEINRSPKPVKGLSRRPTRWTKEELELAARLIAERKPDSEFRKLLGRSKAYAQGCILYHPERLKYVRGTSLEVRVNVPPHVWEDANRRAAAPRTLSAWICGDPAPGQSALDKRHG